MNMKCSNCYHWQPHYNNLNVPQITDQNWGRCLKVESLLTSFVLGTAVIESKSKYADNRKADLVVVQLSTRATHFCAMFSGINAEAERTP